MIEEAESTLTRSGMHALSQDVPRPKALTFFDVSSTLPSIDIDLLKGPSDARTAPARRRAGRVLLLAGRDRDVGQGRRGDGRRLQGAVGPGTRADREPVGQRRGTGLRVRPDAQARPVAAHRELPPQEARAGRPAGTRAARRVGVLHGEPRGAPAPREDLRTGRSDRMSEVREQVREHYREVAIDVRDGGDGCCDSGCCGSKDRVWGAELYEAGERAELPDAAVLASLGGGKPIAVAALREGETVLDVGSGGGIDVLLSARRVGSTGHAYGLDMTDEMLDLARRNAADAGAENVEFLKGYIEDVPLPDASVDVIISNCVINLSADKHAVFQEMRRVLRPGGRIGISDVVVSDDPSPAARAPRGGRAGCLPGAVCV